MLFYCDTFHLHFFPHLLLMFYCIYSLPLLLTTVHYCLMSSGVGKKELLRGETLSLSFLSKKIQLAENGDPIGTGARGCSIHCVCSSLCKAGEVLTASAAFVQHFAFFRHFSWQYSTLAVLQHLSHLLRCSRASLQASRACPTGNPNTISPFPTVPSFPMCIFTQNNILLHRIQSEAIEKWKPNQKRKEEENWVKVWGTLAVWLAPHICGFTRTRGYSYLRILVNGIRMRNGLDP